MECFRLLLEHLEWIEDQFFSDIRDSMKAGSLWGMVRCGRSKEVNTLELIGQRVRVRVTMLRFLGSSGRDSVGIGQHSSNRVSDISTRTMHQSTTPSLSQTIWPKWASRQSPSSLWSRPCSLWLLFIPYAQGMSLWDNWGDERGCDEGHWHAHKKGPPWGLAEVVGTEQQMHCNRRRLLRRGLSINWCVYYQ